MNSRQNISDRLSESQKGLLNKHLSLLLKSNESINLTRISDPDKARVLHIEDSLAGLPEVNDAPEGLYGDLGSGNGYPGIPISIASGRQTILVESIKKKALVLEQIVDSLGLSSQIKIYAERIEEVSIREEESFAVLTARALSSLPSLLELASPLLQQDGRLVCYKSQLLDDEFEAAARIEKKLGFQLLSDAQYCLSDGETFRSLITYKKVGDAEIVLPRRVGSAQKNPLSG